MKIAILSSTVFSRKATWRMFCSSAASSLRCSSSAPISSRPCAGDYSYIDQSVSELRAIGAPTRAFLLPVLIVYSLLEIAFRMGVRGAAGQKRPLHIAGVLLIGLGAVDLVAPFTPMHLRGAGFTLTDRMHIILTIRDRALDPADHRVRSRCRRKAVPPLLGRDDRDAHPVRAWAFLDAPRITRKPADAVGRGKGAHQHLWLHALDAGAGHSSLARPGFRG